MTVQLTATGECRVPKPYDTTHLKTSVQVLHLLGVLSLRHSDILLHLLGFGLDIFSDLDELVDRDFEGSDERCRIEG